MFLTKPQKNLPLNGTTSQKATKTALSVCLKLETNISKRSYVRDAYSVVQKLLEYHPDTKYTRK